MADSIIYTPEELVERYRRIMLGTNELCSKLMVRGIYRRNDGMEAYEYRYDQLEDESTHTSIDILFKKEQLPLRERLAPNMRITVVGVPYISNNKKSKNLALNLSVTDVQEMVLPTLTPNKLRSMEAVRTKLRNGKKTIPAISDVTDDKYKVCLILPLESVADSDIFSPLNGYEDSCLAIDTRHVNTHDTESVVAALREADEKEYQIIVISRGGGSGLEHLDHPDILEAITQLKTPLVVAIGHVDDKLYIKDMADLTLDVPNHLGRWLYELQCEKSRGEVSDTAQARIMSLENEKKNLQDEVDKTKEELNKLFIEKVNINKQYRELLAEVNELRHTPSIFTAIPVLKHLPPIAQYILLTLAAIGLLSMVM